jgi:hypothetical protein
MRARLDGRSGGRLAILGLAVGLVLASGVAYATIPDGSGVIHGCYSKSGGSLRVIDVSVTNCKGGETSLDWNNTGPQGPQGPQGQQGLQGPQGIQGPQGPAGPTHAYEAAYPNSVNITNGAELVKLNIPAGNYAVLGKTTLGTVNLSGECWLNEGQNVLDYAFTSVSGTHFVNVSLIGTVALPNGGTVALKCLSVDGEAQWSKLIALPVDALN